MDDDGANVECIGHLNLGTALHPVVLMDGRLIFSSLESQGSADLDLVGPVEHPSRRHQLGAGLERVPAGREPECVPLPDPVVRRVDRGRGVLQPDEQRLRRVRQAAGARARRRPAVWTGLLWLTRVIRRCAAGVSTTAEPRMRRLPFSPRGIEALTPFARTDEGPADFAMRGDRYGPRVGKVTHPSAAPDNHLLTVWSPGPVNGGYTVHVPAVDSGLYLLKGGKPIDEPARLLLIKNDPRYNEQWPRASSLTAASTASTEPKRIAPLANDGKLSPSLPEGTPFGLVGTSSLYKRESYPNGVVPPGSVTATFAGGTDRTGGFQDLDPFNTSVGGVSLELVQPGSRRRALLERRHPRHPHPRDGADDRPPARTEIGPHVPQPCQRTPAHPRRDPRPQVSARVDRDRSARSKKGRGANRPIPTATPTPASWPGSPRTWPSRSRRSTSTAWS